MKTKLILTFFAIFALFNEQLVAQTRVRFARGKSSATMTGSIGRKASKCYLLGARDGQLIEAKLRSRSGKAQFLFHFGAGPYKGGEEYSTSAAHGDNEVCIENFDQPTTFFLTIWIK